MPTPLDNLDAFYAFLSAIKVDADKDSLAIEISYGKLADNAFEPAKQQHTPEDEALHSLLENSHAVTTSENSPRFTIYFDYIYYYQMCDEFYFNVSPYDSEESGQDANELIPIVSEVNNPTLEEYLRENTQVFSIDKDAKTFLITASNKCIYVVSAEAPSITASQTN